MLVLILILLLGPCSSDAPEDLFCEGAECGVGGAGGAGGSGAGGSGDGGSEQASTSTSASSTGGAGGEPGASTGGAGDDAAGTGGTGGDEPQCRTAADCNSVDTACRWATCEDGWCGVEFAQEGTKLPDDVRNDCKSVVCNGRGGKSHVSDMDDWPDDKNECTTDSCSEDGPVHVPDEAGTPCDGGVCNLGECVECAWNEHCGAGRRCVLGTCE